MVHIDCARSGRSLIVNAENVGFADGALDARGCGMSDKSFEDAVKNLLKTPPKPHKPAKAENVGDGHKPAPCADSEEQKS